MAFAISAFFAGICGGVYVQVIGFVSPRSFDVFQSINYLTTIVVGGLASILGSILGAAVFVLVPEVNTLLEKLHLPQANQAPDVLYGISLILVMIFMPYGFAGFIRRLGRLQPASMAQSVSGFLGQLGLRVRTIRSDPGDGSTASSPGKGAPGSGGSDGKNQGGSP